jgi:hypothetical protein
MNHVAVSSERHLSRWLYTSSAIIRYNEKVKGSAVHYYECMEFCTPSIVRLYTNFVGQPYRLMAYQ